VVDIMLNEDRSTAPAIKVARVGDGWSWILVTDQGALAEGRAAEQDAAMHAAWRAARSFAPGPRAFPEIVVV
jgi:hypothetical protein